MARAFFIRFQDGRYMEKYNSGFPKNVADDEAQRYLFWRSRRDVRTSSSSSSSGKIELLKRQPPRNVNQKDDEFATITCLVSRKCYAQHTAFWSRVRPSPLKIAVPPLDGKRSPGRSNDNSVHENVAEVSKKRPPKLGTPQTKDHTFLIRRVRTSNSNRRTQRTVATSTERMYTEHLTSDSATATVRQCLIDTATQSDRRLLDFGDVETKKETKTNQGDAVLKDISDSEMSDEALNTPEYDMKKDIAWISKEIQGLTKADLFDKSDISRIPDIPVVDAKWTDPDVSSIKGSSNPDEKAVSSQEESDSETVSEDVEPVVDQKRTVEKSYNIQTVRYPKSPLPRPGAPFSSMGTKWLDKVADDKALLEEIDQELAQKPRSLLKFNEVSPGRPEKIIGTDFLARKVAVNKTTATQYERKDHIGLMEEGRCRKYLRNFRRCVTCSFYS